VTLLIVLSSLTRLIDCCLALQALVSFATKHSMDDGYINRKDAFGYSPILLAAAARKFRFVEYLLSVPGVEVNVIIPIPPQPEKKQEKSESPLFSITESVLFSDELHT
jgi:hypothetical protein